MTCFSSGGLGISKDDEIRCFGQWEGTFRNAQKPVVDPWVKLCPVALVMVPPAPPNDYEYYDEDELEFQPSTYLVCLTKSQVNFVCKKC